VIVNILELSIMNATAPLEICISGGGCALAALNYFVLDCYHCRVDRRKTNLFISNSVWHEPTFVAYSTRLELVGTTCIFTVDQAHEFRSSVAVIIRWAICWNINQYYLLFRSAEYLL
jgi:hypothetical protein